MKKVLIAFSVLVPATVISMQGCTITTTSTPTYDGGASSSSSGSLLGDAGIVTGGGATFGEPNDTRDTAFPISFATDYTGIALGTKSDQDWYQLTAPADNSGGYVKVTVSNVAGGLSGNAAIQAYAASTAREIIYHYTSSDNETNTVIFAVKPGDKFNVKVDAFGGFDSGGTYNLRADYTKFDDAFEPNDTRDTAATGTVGTPIDAVLAATNTGAAPTDADIEDWYKFTLAAGTATIKIENVPTDVTVQTDLYNPTNGLVDSHYGGTNGESYTRPNVTLVAGAGTYTVRVTAFSRPERAYPSATPPDSYTRKYKLTVSQP